MVWNMLRKKNTTHGTFQRFCGPEMEAINIFYIRRKKAVYLVGRSRERYSCHITYRPETPPSPGPPPPNSIGGQA